MMITNLPMDLMEEIISRVPLKSMRAVQLTCTEWNTLSKSQILTKMHSGKAFAPAKEDECESRMIMLMEENIYLMSFFINKDVNDFAAEKVGKLTCLNEQVKISDVSHCEGLLLCILKDDDTKVVVWNPYLGQTRWIEARYSHLIPRGQGMFSYGVGYEDKRSGRSYKILRFIDFFFYQEWNEFFWYEIYDFESDLWTTLDVTPYWRKASGNGVSVKGNTYLSATKRDAQGWDGRNGHVTHIICFDYTRNRFGPLLTLPCGYQYVHVTLSCVREEKLAALCDSEENYYVFSIWITTMIEPGEVLWSKFLNVIYDSLPDDIQFSFAGFYIDQVKKVAMLSGKRLSDHTFCIINNMGEYEGEMGIIDECTDENWWRSLVCCYVPSLVQIKQPKGGQRAKQSDSENFRFDEMMSRVSLFRWRCRSFDP